MSTMSEPQVDCSPLSQACIKALTDRLEEKRKLAANEIEKMTFEFSASNNLTMINRLIIVLGRTFCLANNPNTRKGGLMGLAAVMVGFKNGSVTEPPVEIVEEVVRPILTCLQDSDSRVRYYACESMYNVTKVAKSNILPMFESVFDNLAKIVADNDVGVRSGAEVLDRLLKDIVVEQQDLELEGFIPKLGEYIYTNNTFTRMFIISWVRILDSKMDLIKHLPHLLDGIYNCLYDSTEEIRASTLNLLSEFLNKIAMCPTDRLNIPLLVNVLLKHAKNEKEDVVQYTALAWLRQFVGLMDHDDLIQILLQTLSARSDAVVKNALRIIADIFSESENQVIFDRRSPENRPRKVAISTISENSGSSQNSVNIGQFVQALCKTFRNKETLFEERGTFIILNLCTMVKPEIIFRTFAEILKDDKLDSKFSHKLVHKLNQILLTTQPLHALRGRLSNDEDPEMVALFHTLYYAWCHSSVATITLCLLTSNYRLASEIVVALSQADITVDILTQIDWVVQLIESPVFAPMRMKLLETNSNQYLLQTLYGLLMILPQSEAYRKLSHRLDQVYKFMSSHNPPKSNPSNQSAAASKAVSTSSSNKEPKKSATSTNIESLMKHYNTVQNQRTKIS